MEAPNNSIDLTITMGDDKPTHQLLGEFNVTNYGTEQVSQIKQKAKLTDDIGQNIVALFKYSVMTGRQAEAERYFRDAQNGEIVKQLMSPLQFINKKLPQQDIGKVDIQSTPGQVVVRYTIFTQDLDEQVKTTILNNIGKFQTFHMHILLKGFVSHTLKNRTNVKVDYAKVNITSEKSDTSVLTTILSENEMIPSEVFGNPFFSSFGKIKHLRLNLKFKGFREMNKYYSEVANENTYKKKQEKEDFKYTNNGLFRQSVEGYLFFGNEFAVAGNLTHHGEDVFMRLIKVYFKAGKKGLGK